MELREKAAQLPLLPGVYLYKDEHGEVIYVGKAKNLRARVRSYFSDERLADVKTGTLISEARDIEYILVDNNKEALALENNLIKQWKPRFNILLRDDKTFPYIKLTKRKISARVRDAAACQGRLHLLWPVFPGQSGAPAGAFHSSPFQGAVLQSGSHAPPHAPVPGVPHPSLPGPVRRGADHGRGIRRAVRDVRLFLEGRLKDLAREMRARMQQASEEMRFEEAAALRDLIATVEEMEEKQKIAAAEGENIDILAYYAEPPLVAANLFHLRNGRIVDRREYFWEDLLDFQPAEFFSSLLKQIYLDQQYIPSRIHVPVDFEDREELEEMLSEKRGHKVEIQTPQRGQKKALLDLVETNAKHAFQQRFRVMKPSSKAMQEALQDALGLPEPPKRIECFDISHIQGTDKVASMVVWEDGRMKKSDYRKFIIRTVVGNDDFASMREVVTRRYSRLQEEKKAFPSLILIDGGLGQLHAAAEALEAIGIINQPHRVDRQARGDHLCARAGERADPAGSLFAGAAPGAEDPRRGAPFRGDVPSHAPGRRTAGFGAGAGGRHRLENHRQAAARVRQPGARAGSTARGTGEGDRPGRGAPLARVLQCVRSSGIEGAQLMRPSGSNRGPIMPFVVSAPNVRTPAASVGSST